MTSLSARGHGASSGQKRLMNASAAQGVTNADPDPSHWIPILSQERKEKRQRRPMRLSPDFQWPCVLPQAVQGWVAREWLAILRTLPAMAKPRKSACRIYQALDPMAQEKGWVGSALHGQSQPDLEVSASKGGRPSRLSSGIPLILRWRAAQMNGLVWCRTRMS
ncbi:hypothetical protein CIRG_06272 [Coccidioides immitis RMSCC 2394]|uniref:Uncharacterized protein n=1 Tax=Coccidioides immitis RMSCC 2394 TaxID=404692 RepID=A0A0J6YD13_COCIT|nr:hypothetical protein CIRG_06272 [Coccidioides immitis RMSCC 2394]